MQVTRSIVLAAALLTLAGSASAQDLSKLMNAGSAERSWHIGVGGGLSMPLADAKDALDNGVNGQVYLTWAPRVLPWALRVAANYDRHGLKGLSSGQEGNGSLLGALGGLQIGMPVGPLRPYITAGVGAFNMTSEIDGQTASATKLGVDAGVGLQVKIRSISGFVEGRLQNVFSSDTGVSGAAQSFDQLKTQIIPVTFGLQF